MTAEATADTVSEQGPGDNEMADITKAEPELAEVDVTMQGASEVEAGSEDASSSTPEIPEDVSSTPDTQPARTPEPETNTATQSSPAEQGAPVSESTPNVALPQTDRSGLTDTGRAVNDPRVEPRPVGELNVVTLRTALFNDQEAPALSVMARDVPRASNDPRGPKEGESVTQGEMADVEDTGEIQAGQG